MKSKKRFVSHRNQTIKSKNICFTSVCESIIYKIGKKKSKKKVGLVGRLPKQD